MSAESGPEPAANRDSLPATGFALLAGITLFWGANWPMMKIALTDLPVWSFRSLCLVAGGCGLLLLSRLGGRRLALPAREVGPLLLVAVFNVIGWHLFSGYGVSLIPAGRAAIVAFTMPLWATALAIPILGEAMTRAKAAGLALGLAGLAVLIGPDLGGLGTAPLGAAMMLGAAVSWATGTVLFKRFSWSIGSGALAGWQLLAGALVIVPGALIIDGPPTGLTVTGPAILATLYVLLLPMIFCQWAYLELVRIFPAAIAAIGTLAIPVVGVFASALVLGEAVGWREILALGLVCSALAVVMVLPAWRRWRGV